MKLSSKTSYSKTVAVFWLTSLFFPREVTASLFRNNFSTNHCQSFWSYCKIKDLFQKATIQITACGPRNLSDSFWGGCFWRPARTSPAHQLRGSPALGSREGWGGAADPHLTGAGPTWLRSHKNSISLPWNVIIGYCQGSESALPPFLLLLCSITVFWVCVHVCAVSAKCTYSHEKWNCIYTYMCVL